MPPTPSTLLCPRCRGELAQASVSNVQMSVCDLCGGVWLDNQGATRVTAALHSDAVRIAKEAAQGAMASASTEQLIRCPACSSTMERTTAGGTDVVVDRCAQHGTWFDRNELILASTLAEQRRQAGGAPPSVAAAPKPGGPPRPGQASGDLVRKILR